MKEVFEKKEITKKSEDFSQWYTDVILKAGLADYSPVKGCMVFRPYGYAIWENIQKILDGEIKKAGVKNAYFPLFIPESFLKREKEHVKGFSPELAVVTIGGGEELKERLVVRPTSETIINEMFAKWIKSWRDLPVMINQWCNVVRWEMRTRLFLRTTEFLWQEGHTAHQTKEEAGQEVKRALRMYVDFYQKILAIDGFFGKKSEAEKFPGAEQTFAYEMLMSDGKVLQGCTSHDLGQNFAKVFNIRFLGKDGKEKTPWQTSWGISSRSIGAIIMAHGDDSGLILPPEISPVQVVIIPISRDKKRDKVLEKKTEELKALLKDFRVEIDDRKEYSPGWKFNEWELKGVPLRIEIGQKELKEKKLTLVRRDDFRKYQIPFGSAAKETKKVLDSFQRKLFEASSRFLRENTREAPDYEEFKDIMRKKKGLLKAFWCEDLKCEAKIKEETKATTRVSVGPSAKAGKCVYCGKKTVNKWIFGQAY